jgi:hypothetical protein
MSDSPPQREVLLDPTYVLSMSGARVTCEDVAEIIRFIQMPCSITPNVTMLHSGATDGSVVTENGCRIVFNEKDLADSENTLVGLWGMLQTRFQLDCANLEVRLNFDGCIYDFLSRSVCPGGAVAAAPTVVKNTPFNMMLGIANNFARNSPDRLDLSRSTINVDVHYDSDDPREGKQVNLLTSKPRPGLLE